MMSTKKLPDDDEVPELVENFDEVAINDKKSEDAVTSRENAVD